jgi:addiction module HigA family antidote
MRRHAAPHPGMLIVDDYLKARNLSGRLLAKRLGVSASTLSRVLDGTSAISPEMALRLSKALGRSAESWLVLQNTYDLWQARQCVKLEGIKRLKLKVGRPR